MNTCGPAKCPHALGWADFLHFPFHCAWFRGRIINDDEWGRRQIEGNKMAVRVVIRRIVPEDRAQDLEPLLAKLRSRASLQPGYISGETLRRLDKPDEYLVISTWESAEDWDRWATSQERHEVQDKIDTLLGGKTESAVFHSVLGSDTPRLAAQDMR